MTLLIADEPDPICCRRLRAKGVPGEVYSDHVSFADGYVSTATFWCMATADATGPDDSYVHPHACVEPRACFASPDANGPAKDE